MANIYVKVNTGLRLGNELQKVGDMLCAAQSHIVQVKNTMDNMTNGVDFTTIETNFGIPTGQGQGAYNTIVSAVASMTGSAAIQTTINALGSIAS